MKTLDGSSPVTLYVNGQPRCGQAEPRLHLGDFLRSPIDDSSPVLKFLHALVHFEKPMVAAVHGLAIGIEQSSVNRDAFTFDGVRSEIAGIQPVKANMKIGADRL